ncbi:MAG TPA: flagellar assembly protein FliW [Candidatus Lambdaproteobacteria bacterium]|nr:flagellar assembly protein FliW [SAR324 cluster bacterium]HBL55110.1 flagellar assembly protein FliW [Deltaproteobacteria bacterium]HHZ77989.1 flagellar assembly protein FliW [Candidatus Lambdaproteobacteria bacterium]HIA56538.1 flagellar assembly protein FliW [Candidatus Lambdaproteobacteria bacterium]HIB45640.1 flagellar assembly protein FliW [Candidatus Lambdaproteobacteria bacterium]
MLIKTSRFGEIEIEENQIITIPSGLIGFSEDRRFVIREDEAASPFRWLQAIDTEALAFVMIEPHVSISNYELELTKDNLNKLKAESIDELTVFVLVTMAKKMDDVTVNLQGPLLFNLEKRLGLQFIIPNGKYSTRHSLFGDKLSKKSPIASAQESAAEEQQVASD